MKHWGGRISVIMMFGAVTICVLTAVYACVNTAIGNPSSSVGMNATTHPYIQATTDDAQGWRGISPIRSSCKNVERLLGGRACGKQTIEYTLPDTAVRFVFADHPCHVRWPYDEYAAPAGTVTAILITPRAPKRLYISDLGIDVSKLGKRHVSDTLGVTEYGSLELGIKFTASETGQILDITYFPAERYDNLRCPHLSEPQLFNERPVATSFLSGRFHPASANEKKNLDRLLSDLKGFDNTALAANNRKAAVYVIAYAGRRASLDEARHLAERLKNRLVREYNVEADRINAVDGGYRERAVVELFITSFGVPAPVISPSIHPIEVDLIKDRGNKP